MEEKITSALRKLGIEKLTEVQEKAFYPIYQGKNCLIISPTGTGKTLAALLPIFQKWLELKPKPTSILYISPMKALNRDQLEHLLFWSEELGIEISVRHGDTSSYERKLQAEFANDFLILTIEALQSVLVGRKMREHLKNVKWVILDEVHEVVESKRGVQLTLALERLRELSKGFQIIMLSATIGEPEKVARFFGGKDVEIINVKYDKPIEIKVVYPKEEEIDEKISSRLLISKDASARVRYILETIKNRKSVLIFTNTREFAEILASRLKLLSNEFNIAVHHSSLSKEVRIKTEKEFKEGKIKALVCTSSLQLGVDIGSVDLVIQYQSPREVTQLLQRVGRSGHKFWAKSEGIIIATDEDDILESAVIVRKALNGELEKIFFHEKCLDVLAHQIVGIALDFGKRVEIEKCYSIVKRAFPYENLKKEEFQRVVNFLEKIGIINVKEGKIVLRRKAFEYYFSQLSTIPDVKEYKAINVLDGTVIGNLDEEFVTLYGEEGATFILKGETYRIVSIDEDKVYVEPTKERDAAVPSWVGELIPVPFEVALEVGRIRKMYDSLGNYKVDENCVNRIKKFYESQRKKFIPSDKEIYVEYFDNKIIIHASFGNRVNETLAKLIVSKLYYSVKNRNDAYRIILVFPEKVDKLKAEKVKEILLNLKPSEIEKEIDLHVFHSELFLLRFINVAKRFGVIEKDASIKTNLARKLAEEFFGTPLYEESLKELKTEKLDLKNCRSVLEKICDGEIKIEIVEGPSELSSLALKRVFIDYFEENSENLLNIFKNRILERKVKLICMNCGWTVVYVLKDLPENFSCRRCGARLIAPIRENNVKAERIISRRLKNFKLSKEEEKEFKKLIEKATFFLYFGRKAAIAFLVKGIGFDTARKIFGKYFRNEDEFFEELYNSYKNFLKTRKYWKI